MNAKDTDRCPDREKRCRETKVEEMPWYSREIEPGRLEELKMIKVKKCSFLDLGTDSGTQAAALTKMRFDAAATDISKTAVAKAIKTSKDVKFIGDDTSACAGRDDKRRIQR